MKSRKYIQLTVLLVIVMMITACDMHRPDSSEISGTNAFTQATPSDLPSAGTEPEETVPSDPATEPTIPIAPIVSANLINGNTGTAIDGVTVQVQNDLVVVKVPLTMSEALLQNATVILTADDGTAVELSAPALNTECPFQMPDGLQYALEIRRESYNLPLMEINTDDGAAINSKETYIHGNLIIDGQSYPMKIRGRGNSSWTTFPKKAYRIKLDDGASLLGLKQNRDWVLTANYPDKSLLRNCVAHSIATSLDGLEFTSTHIPVNLYINGQYMGVYTFSDKIEDGKGRLDLGEPIYDGTTVVDMGFLLETGWDFDQENVYNRDYFDTDHVIRIFVKEPEISQANTPEFLYLKYYIYNMEEAIISNYGWEDYIDVDAWIDWFIVNELTFNTESSFYRSCYFWKPAGGKLKLGPVWDFDMAFGNHGGDLWGYNGWCTTESTYLYFPKDNWMVYLMKYPAFTDRLVTRWNEVKDGLLTTALTAVDEYAAMMDGSQQQNFQVWDIMHQQIGIGTVDFHIYDTYEKQVQYVRDFIINRWNYIDNRLNSSEYSH